MAIRFKMLPRQFLESLTALDLLELKAHFQIEYEDQQQDGLAHKARAGAKQRMRR